jgi:hypothetical protein
MKFYTYIHTRADDLQVFYVGKGHGRRAYRTYRRNSHWQNVVNKHDYKVDICSYFATDQEAQEHERFLIACFRQIGAPLTNMTDGGDGAAGLKPSAETLRKRSLALRGKKRTAETRAKMSVAATGRKMSAEAVEKSRQANLGRALSKAHVEKVRQALTGRAQPPELVEKRVAKLRGKKRSPEVCAKFSALRKGKKQTPEHIAKAKAARAASMQRKKEAVYAA